MIWFKFFALVVGWGIATASVHELFRAYWTGEIRTLEYQLYAAVDGPRWWYWLLIIINLCYSMIGIMSAVIAFGM